jgi:plasmid maintenance system killer protein
MQRAEHALDEACHVRDVRDPSAVRREHWRKLGRRRAWIWRKLDQIDSVAKLDDLRVPPGNRLHQLIDDLAGFHAIRVNEQYRIVFRFVGEHAFDVRCTDYH